MAHPTAKNKSNNGSIGNGKSWVSTALSSMLHPRRQQHHDSPCASVAVGFPTPVPAEISFSVTHGQILQPRNLSTISLPDFRPESTMTTISLRSPEMSETSSLSASRYSIGVQWGYDNKSTNTNRTTSSLRPANGLSRALETAIGAGSASTGIARRMATAWGTRFTSLWSLLSSSDTQQGTVLEKDEIPVEWFRNGNDYDTSPRHTWVEQTPSLPLLSCMQIATNTETSGKSPERNERHTLWKQQQHHLATGSSGDGDDNDKDNDDNGNSNNDSDGWCQGTFGREHRQQCKHQEVQKDAFLRGSLGNGGNCCQSSQLLPPLSIAIPHRYQHQYHHTPSTPGVVEVSSAEEEEQVASSDTLSSPSSSVWLTSSRWCCRPHCPHIDDRASIPLAQEASLLTYHQHPSNTDSTMTLTSFPPPEFFEDGR